MRDPWVPHLSLVYQTNVFLHVSHLRFQRNTGTCAGTTRLVLAFSVLLTLQQSSIPPRHVSPLWSSMGVGMVRVAHDPVYGSSDDITLLAFWRGFHVAHQGFGLTVSSLLFLRCSCKSMSACSFPSGPRCSRTDLLGSVFVASPSIEPLLKRQTRTLSLLN